MTKFGQMLICMTTTVAPAIKLDGDVIVDSRKGQEKGADLLDQINQSIFKLGKLSKK